MLHHAFLTFIWSRVWFVDFTLYHHQEFKYSQLMGSKENILHIAMLQSVEDFICSVLLCLTLPCFFFIDSSRQGRARRGDENS